MERRLAAILAADVQGYSHLTELNEESSTATLRSYSAVVEEAIAAHRGHSLSWAGDGVGAEFPSVVEAIRCAAEIQDEIAELHERYMDEPGPTDVLTFPLDDEHDVDENGVRMLGDVVIAPGVAARNNPDDPASELRLLVVHGVLHALGYDHEDDADRVEMWARQERYSGVAVP